MEEMDKEKNSFKKEFFQKYLPFVWEVVKIFIVASVIVLPIRYFLFQPFIVKGDSMAPNFQSGDYLIVDELSYRFSEPQRGDVVVFKYPKDPAQRFIKRIIGLPGETVEIKAGDITILKAGEKINLDENYLLDDLKTYGEIAITLSEKEYFVLGDNRDFSYDSRRWGSVPKENIIGRAFLRIFPLASLSQFIAPNY